MLRKGALHDLGVFKAAGLVDRRARLYVPAHAGGPVVVMFDGQNAFGDEGSYAGGWHADETVERMTPSPAIIAVDHGGAERIAELGAPRSAKLPKLLDLIVEQVLPAAHARVRLGYGPDAHRVVGSSMGGLAALYAHFSRPDVFGGAVAMSPSLWYDGRAILPWLDARPAPHPSWVYLDAGAKEGGGRLAAVVETLGERLRARRVSVSVRIDPRGTHEEASWRRRLPKALGFVFDR